MTIYMDSTIFMNVIHMTVPAGSMNDNINIDSTIAGSMNDNINMDSTIAGSMNDNINMVIQLRVLNDNINMDSIISRVNE